MILASILRDRHRISGLALGLSIKLDRKGYAGLGGGGCRKDTLVRKGDLLVIGIDEFSVLRSRALAVAHFWNGDRSAGRRGAHKRKSEFVVALGIAAVGELAGSAGLGGCDGHRLGRRGATGAFFLRETLAVGLSDSGVDRHACVHLARAECTHQARYRYCAFRTAPGAVIDAFTLTRGFDGTALFADS